MIHTPEGNLMLKFVKIVNIGDLELRIYFVPF